MKIRIPRKLKKEFKKEFGDESMSLINETYMLKRQIECLKVVKNVANDMFFTLGGVMYNTSSALLCEDGDVLCELHAEKHHLSECIKEVLKWLEDTRMVVSVNNVGMYANRRRCFVKLKQLYEKAKEIY